MELRDILMVCEDNNPQIDWNSFDVSKSKDRIVALGAPRGSDGDDPEMWLFFTDGRASTRLDDPNKPSTKISLMDLPFGYITWADNDSDIIMEEAVSSGSYWRFIIDRSSWSIIGCDSIGVRVTKSEAHRLKTLSKGCFDAKYPG